MIGHDLPETTIEEVRDKISVVVGDNCTLQGFINTNNTDLNRLSSLLRNMILLKVQAEAPVETKKK